MKNKTNLRGLLFTLRMIIPLFYLNPISASDGLPAPYSVTLSQINCINLLSNPTDVQIKDGYAYLLTVNAESGVINTLNLYDPLNIPAYKSFSSISSKAVALTVNGPYVYIGESDGNIITANFKNRDLLVISSTIESSGKIIKMNVYNGYLYVLKGDLGLSVYDVSLPDFPITKGVQPVSGEATGLFVKSNYAFITTQNANLSIIDISQISTLPIIGSYLSGINFYDVYVYDNYAYVSQGSTGVQVLDISKISNPVHETNIFSRKCSKQVVINNYYTWVNDDNTIQAFYNKNPLDQEWAGSFDNMGVSINRIDVEDGKYIYMCSSDNKLKIIQITYNY